MQPGISRLLVSFALGTFGLILILSPTVIFGENVNGYDIFVRVLGMIIILVLFGQLLAK